MINRLSKPSFSEQEYEAIGKVLGRGWVGPNGPEVKAFEEELAEYLGDDVFVLATNSGTSALHLALQVLGVQAGDIVLQQTYGYCAPAFTISYQGAETIFIDSESETWGMCPKALNEALVDIEKNGKLSRVKAIIPVHVFGVPTKLNELMPIAAEYGVPIIEDAAESIGSKQCGKALGTIGDLGILSFNANKILSAGSGGALISKNKEWINRARFLGNQALIEGEIYHHQEVGYNYCMNDLTASIARVQLQRLSQLLQMRRSLNEVYRNELSGKFEFQQINPNDRPNFWLSAIRVPDAKKFMDKTNLADIEFRPGFQPIHQYPIYQSKKRYGTPISEDLVRSVLTLPSGIDVQIEQVIDRIRKFYN